MTARQPLHLMGAYHLPSWQGGSRTLPRCSYNLLGWDGARAGGHMTENRDKVTCRRCKDRMARDVAVPVVDVMRVPDTLTDARFRRLYTRQSAA